MDTDGLFERYVRGLLTESDREELKRLLLTEEGARQFYDFIREWSLLADVSRQMVAAPHEEAVPIPAVPGDEVPGAGARARRRARPIVRPARTRLVWAAGFAAVALALAGVTIFRELVQRNRSAAASAGAAPPASADSAAAPQPTDREEWFIPDLAATRVASAGPARDPFPGGMPPPGAGPEFELPPAPRTAGAEPAGPSPDADAPSPAEGTAASVETFRGPDASRTPAAATQPTLARVEQARGTVSLLSEAGPATPARAGQPLLAGQGLRTAGRDGRAAVVFPDLTRLELGADTTLLRLAEGRPDAAGAGKGAFVERGQLTATVSRQPGGRPFALRTPHADVLVLGTRLALSVSPAATRLDVEQGRVRFTRRSDGAAVDVAADQYATTEGTGPLTARSRERLKTPDVVRLIDELEGPMRWHHGSWSAPVEFVVTNEQSYTGRHALLVSFQPRESEPEAGATFVHPVMLLPTDRALRFYAKVLESGGKPEWSLSLREKDGDHWHLGGGPLDALPNPKGWNPLEVALPDGTTEASRGSDGDGRYDVSAVESFSFSVGGGRVIFLLDTVLAVEATGRENLFPVKPSRAGE